MTIARLHAGPRMSQAVIHGSTIYLAGQVADQAKGKSVGDQTKEILAAIERLLAEAGSDKTRILSATIYLADIATFGEMNAVWDAWVPAGHAPARATIEAKLAAPASRRRVEDYLHGRDEPSCAALLPAPGRRRDGLEETVSVLVLSTGNIKGPFERLSDASLRRSTRLFACTMRRHTRCMAQSSAFKDGDLALGCDARLVPLSRIASDLYAQRPSTSSSARVRQFSEAGVYRRDGYPAGGLSRLSARAA